MTATEPSVLEPLWSGESVFCHNWGHHVNCHNTGKTPLCNYRTAGIMEDCVCKEFVSHRVVKEGEFI